MISGYLISKLILVELAETNRFSFRNFYERRIRRILPALFVVMLASAPLAWQLMLPSEFSEYSKSIIASLGFGSNYYFYLSSTDYGAGPSLLKPFLHTWSLSIEEQFYVIFPIALLVLRRFFKRYLIGFVLLGILVSLLLSELTSPDNSELKFFSLHTRSWELLTGTLLALLDLKYGRNWDPLLHRTLPIAGLFLVAHSILFFDESTPHPGLFTLVPVFGVSLIIFFSNTRELTGKILSSKPFVAVGLISYSLYLWHFPILAFARITSYYDESSLNKLIVGLVIVVLSIATYHMVEKPFRNRVNFSSRHALTAVSLVFVAVLSFNVVILQGQGMPERVSPVFAVLDTKPWEDLKNVSGEDCHGNPEFCYFSSQTSTGKVVLIGDSHAAVLADDLREQIAGTYDFGVATYPGCYPVKGYDGRKVQAFGFPGECDPSYQESRLEWVSNIPNSVVVLAGNLPVYVSGRRDGKDWPGGHTKADLADLEDGIRNMVLSLLDDGHPVVLVYPIPEANSDVPNEIWQKIRVSTGGLSKHLENDPLTTNFASYEVRARESFKVLDSIEHENLLRIYPHSLFCDGSIPGRCSTHDSEVIFYADDNHLSPSGGRLVNALILDQIDTLITRQNKTGSQLRLME